MKRIGALFIKELQDLRTNANVTVMYILPILLTLIWDKLIPDMPAGWGVGFGLMFLVTMVGMYVPSMLIAEEKEKHTIEVLLFSPATPAEILIGKALLTFVSIQIVGIVLLLVSGSYTQLPTILAGLMLSSAFSIFIGMMIGLLAPNQMATGVIGLPFYLGFMLIPNLSVLEIPVVNKIAAFVPTEHFLTMVRLAAGKGQGLSDMYPQLGVLALSCVITFALLLMTYKRKGMTG